MGDVVNTNLNTAPYHDDYDENNGFERILYRPGFSVQARELNQMQTIVNKQQERIANYFFNDGDTLSGGNLVVNTDVIAYTLTGDLATIIAGSEITVGIKRSRVVHKESDKLYCVTITQTFAVAEVLDQGNNITVSAVSPASVVSVEKGVFYIGGFPLVCQSQTIVLSETSATPSAKIGFVVNSEIITENHEELGEALGDNSLGSSNTRAPGAHRLQATLVLSKRGLNEVTTTDTFIELTRLVNGLLNRYEVDKFATEFGKRLAHRTFEESGNYIIEPFELFINTRVGAGNDAKFPVDIIGGQAYVRGFEYNGFGKRTIDVLPAIDTEAVQGSHDISPTFGNYVICESPGNQTNFAAIVLTPDIANQPVIELHCSTTILNTENTTQIGTAKVVALQPHVDETIRAYLRDETYTPITGTFAGAQDGTTDPILTTDLSNAIPDRAYVDMNIQIDGHVYRIIDSYVDTDPNPNVLKLQISGALRTAVDSTTTFNILPEKGNIKSLAILVTGDADFITWKADVAASEIENNRTIFRDTGGSSLLFPFPVEYVSNVANNFSYWTIDKVSSASNSYSASDETFYPGTEVSASAFTRYLNNYFGLITSGDNRGEIMEFTEGNLTSGTLTLESDKVIDATDTVDIFRVVQQSVAIKNKALRESTSGSADLSTATTGVLFVADPEDIISLLQADVIHINKICEVGSLTDFDVADASTYTDYYDDEDIDVTDKYILDNGQRDFIYDHAAIILKSGETVDNAIAIHFSYFDTDASAGIFSVNSYSGIGYANIPSYTSLAEQITYRLSDVLDFRPVRLSDDNNGDAVYSSVVLPDTSFPIGSPSDGIDYSFYLGRKDLIALEPNGDINVIEGLPARDPESPEGTDTSMSLFELSLRPFTGIREDISVARFAHKRYTMSEIGKMDRRIRELEELIRISSKTLDQAAASSGRIGGVARDIEDIVVTHNNGDTENVDYDGAYDYRHRYFRPSFDVDFTPFDVEDINISGTLEAYDNTDEVSDGTDEAIAVQMLPYATEAFINQAAYNDHFRILSGVAGGGYNGYAKITLRNHPWYDRGTTPDIQIKDLGWLNKGFGSEWDEWSIRWTGLEDNFVNDALEANAGAAAARGGGRFIDTGVKPYVGEAVFDWEVVGMRPNVEIYAYIDGNQIGDDSVGITDANGFLSSTEVNADGTTATAITIDAGTRVSGKWQISFVDQDETTRAEGQIYARGLPSRGSRGYIRPEFVKSDVANYQPISQLFTVDVETYPKGIFLTDIELFFEEIGGDAPVIVTIRELDVLGDPSLSIVEGSVVARVLEATDLTSERGATFTFDSPVYLPAEDYCITVESESREYSIRIGNVGNPLSDAATEGVVPRGPALGNFYGPGSDDLQLRLACRLNKAIFSDQDKVVDLVVSDDFDVDVINFYMDTLLIPDASLSYRQNFIADALTVVRANRNISARTRQNITDNTKKLEVTMKTDSQDVSPVIDMTRVGLISILNDISEYEGDSSDSENGVIQGGNAACRYITQPVYVNQSVNNMTVSVEAVNPAQGSIEVYYKVLSDQDTESLEAKEWVRMEAINSFDSTHVDDYRTYSFKPSPEPISYTKGTDTFYTFDTYILKVVLYSSAKSVYDIPRIRGPFNTGIRVETYLTNL